MVRIVTDSASHFTKKQAAEIGVEMAPLFVSIGKDTYRDYEDITDVQLVHMIHNGALPLSSQPSIGEKTDIYNRCIVQGEEVIDITMADGLSGTYQSALIAKDNCDDPEKVTVFNTKTLCTPEHVLVDAAAQMAHQGANKYEIMDMLQKSRATSINFMIPIDFDFLVRGGRTSNASGFLGGLLKLIPIIKANDSATKLEKFAIVRTYKRAFKQMLDDFEAHGVDDSYTLCLGHALNEELVNKAYLAMHDRFPLAKIVVLPISPSFICQGGPGCLAFQAIKIVK